MLDEVMDLARLQAGREVREERPFDAADVLRQLGDGCRPQADQRGLTLRTEGPDTLPVCGDAVKVSRIAQNLLLNAVKYTRAGGVTLGWADGRKGDSQRWEFWVQDTGPGVPVGSVAPLATALQYATEAAKPAAATTTPPPPVPPTAAPPPRGEGIGLSIVKRLCELLDATLEMESRPGEGSTFRVLLPKQFSAPPADTP